MSISSKKKIIIPCHLETGPLQNRALLATATRSGNIVGGGPRDRSPRAMMPGLSAAETQTPHAPTIGHSASGLRAAGTPCPGADTRGEQHETAPTYRRLREWPADQEVRGQLTLKASADNRGARRAVCSVRGGMLMLNIANVVTTASRDSSGARGASNTTALTEVPVKELAVGLQRGRESMFTIATFHRGKMYDEIYCFADNQVKRNKWIAVLRRMGVGIFDVSDGMDATVRRLVRFT